MPGWYFEVSVDSVNEGVQANVGKGRGVGLLDLASLRLIVSPGQIQGFAYSRDTPSL